MATMTIIDEEDVELTKPVHTQVDIRGWWGAAFAPLHQHLRADDASGSVIVDHIIGESEVWDALECAHAVRCECPGFDMEGRRWCREC